MKKIDAEVVAHLTRWYHLDGPECVRWNKDPRYPENSIKVYGVNIGCVYVGTLEEVKARMTAWENSK